MHCIVPPAYFGSVSYFSDLLKFGEAVVDVHSHFEKQSVRSRAEILGANGPLKLIVPLEKWGNRTPMHDIRIDNSGQWPKQHFKSIRSAYGSAPFYEHYVDRFKKFYDQTYSHLSDLDMASTVLILELLDQQIRLSPTERFVPSERGAVETLDLRPKYGRKSKADPQVFNSYLQVFSDRSSFVPDLSIMDLVFNQGPASSEYLQALVKKSIDSNTIG